MYTSLQACLSSRPSRSILLPIAGTLLLAGVPCAGAGDLYFACSAGVSLTMADARDVFLGEKQFVGPVKLLPVDNSSVQADFLGKVMKMDATKYATAWTKKSFRDGSTAPSVKSGDGEVVEYLKHTAGGCGYLASAPPPGLTLVGKL
jgi:hypothetical protein